MSSIRLIPNVVCLLIVSLLAIASGANAQNTTDPENADLQERYERALRSAELWKQRAELLEKEVASLRAQLQRLAASPHAAGPPPAAVHATPQPYIAPPADIEVAIPQRTVVSLENYGGPKRKLQVWDLAATTARVQVDTEGIRHVDLSGGEAPILVDQASGQTVYITNRVTANTIEGKRNATIIIRHKR